ncbi:hypothetical protein BMS3Abin10_00285 [bacterium BMS3Abin10]|nr:hypothetical protein BMS3Abin10_00285 [bacterium BMS3Abin10]GBE37564.1 hypothetical protein BMS3Bbin08_00154 [bacterium BMS3Bbin08]
MFQGLTKELQTPKDLLAKLHCDFARIKANPLDVYAAFDFFVTAEHIPDWVNDIPIKRKVPLLKIVSHIANGAKHFKATDPKLKSVENVHERKGAFQAGAFQPTAFDVGDLIIELKGDEANLFGSEISVRELAQKVIKYWTAQIT